MKYLLYIFYVEILLNLITIFESLFIPAAFLHQLYRGPAPVVALEMARWYGVLLIVLTYLLARGLQLRGQTLKVAFEALLIGDVIQIIVSFVTVRALGAWTLTLILSAVISAIVATVRLICLWKPVETCVDAR